MDTKNTAPVNRYNVFTLLIERDGDRAIISIIRTPQRQDRWTYGENPSTVIYSITRKFTSHADDIAIKFARRRGFEVRWENGAPVAPLSGDGWKNYPVCFVK